MTCIAPECEKPPKATKYLCWAHWYRQKGYGSFDLPTLTCMECGKVVGEGRRKKLCETCRPVVGKRRVESWVSENSEAVRARKREHYLKDPEKVKERAKAWRAENAELVKLRAKEYRENNSERYKGYSIKWARKNAKRSALYNKRHREENPDLYREAVRRRRAKKRNAPTFQVSQRDIHRLLVRHSWCCAYCGKSLAEGYHIDHVVPLSRGGSNSIGNYLPACPTCNDSKGSKFLYEWLRWKRAYADVL